MNVTILKLIKTTSCSLLNVSFNVCYSDESFTLLQCCSAQRLIDCSLNEFSDLSSSAQTVCGASPLPQSDGRRAKETSNATLDGKSLHILQLHRDQIMKTCIRVKLQ